MKVSQLSWREGDPKNAGAGGFVWIVNEDGDKAVVEIDADGIYSKPRGFGVVMAWAGPIDEPDDETLP